jgi:glycerol-3-phosphate dehydrogenase
VYDLLAGRHAFGRHRWHDAAATARLLPALRTDGLLGAYSYFDVQMDDHALGLWAAERAREAGVTIHEHVEVTRVNTQGTIWTRPRAAPADVTTADGVSASYNRVVNVAGPWAAALLAKSDVRASYALDLVRGSHIVLRGTMPYGAFVEVPNERRLCFILPYRGEILVGTTEVRQSLDEPIVCQDEERDYLLAVYNHYFRDARTERDVVRTFAGVRPLIRSADDPSRATREYAMQRTGRLVSVFGGKWTTARALGVRVARLVEGGERSP